MADPNEDLTNKEQVISVVVKTLNDTLTAIKAGDVREGDFTFDLSDPPTVKTANITLKDGRSISVTCRRGKD